MKLTLKAARINAGLTQKKAAEKLGVTEQTISNWENGITYPDVLQGDRIRAIYEIGEEVGIEWKVKKF